MPVYLVVPQSEATLLSYEGRHIEKHRSIEKKCSKCGKKFCIDTRPDFFKMLDKYNIKQSKFGGPTQRMCGSCLVEFREKNSTIDQFL